MLGFRSGPSYAAARNQTLGEGNQMSEVNRKIEALRILADAMNSCTNVPAVMILAEAWVELWREVTRIAPEAVRRAVIA